MAEENNTQVDDNGPIDHAQVCRKFKKGTPMTVLAVDFRCSRQRIHQILKKAGLSRSDGGASERKRRLSARGSTLLNAYRRGESLESIAKKQHVPVATLRQAIVASCKDETRDVSPITEARCQRVWGCSFDEWRALRAMDRQYSRSPIGRYSQFRNNMTRLYPEVPWNLSLLDWWDLWQQSGQYSNMGKNKAAYCLSRIDNDKGFEKSNMGVICVHDLFSRKRRE